MGFLKEFKEFAMRGSVVDLAVGVVIGGAFGKIVTSLVDDIIMPPIGYLTGGVDFSSKKLIIVAFCIFCVIKALNSLKRKEEAAPAAPPAPTKEETLLTEIRDILKNK